MGCVNWLLEHKIWVWSGVKAFRETRLAAEYCNASETHLVPSLPSDVFLHKVKPGLKTDTPMLLAPL